MPKSLGLVKVLPDKGRRDPKLMAAELATLPDWTPVAMPDLQTFLGGLDRITKLAQPWLPVRTGPRASPPIRKTA